MSYMDDLREYEQLLRKLAESVEYQYILNMNYTRFTFREN